MILQYNKNLKSLARKLRNEMTDAEICLWARIKSNQLKVPFYRQKIIDNYIVDFYCPKCNLVIELDGGQHYEDRGMKKDEGRDGNLKNIDGVLMKICEEVKY